MKVTIDSSESSLSDVLRVVGAVYDVTLTVSEKGTAAAPTTGSDPAPAAGKVRTRRARKKPAVDPVASASNEEIRSWALETGMAVSNRGRLPGRVVEAYRDAHRA